VPDFDPLHLSTQISSSNSKVRLLMLVCVHVCRDDLSCCNFFP